VLAVEEAKDNGTVMDRVAVMVEVIAEVTVADMAEAKEVDIKLCGSHRLSQISIISNLIYSIF
jgi:hypothetical protein